MSRTSEVLVNNLHQLVEKSGYSQRELAEKTGIAQPQISNYLTGKVTPQIDALEVFAKVFGVSVAEILNSDEPPTPRIEHPPLAEELKSTVEGAVYEGIRKTFIYMYGYKESKSPEQLLKFLDDALQLDSKPTSLQAKINQLSPKEQHQLESYVDRLLEKQNADKKGESG